MNEDVTFGAGELASAFGDGLNDVFRWAVRGDECLRGDQSSSEPRRDDALRLRLGSGDRHDGALPADVPDALAVLQKLVGEHEVVTEAVALFANVNEVELRVDGNQTERSTLVA